MLSLVRKDSGCRAGGYSLTGGPDRASGSNSRWSLLLVGAFALLTMVCGTRIQCPLYWSLFNADEQNGLKENLKKEFLDQGLYGAFHIGDRFCALSSNKDGYFDLKVIENDQVKWLDDGKRKAVPKMNFVRQNGEEIRWAGNWAWDVRRFRWSRMQTVAKQLMGTHGLMENYIVARSLWRIVNGQFRGWMCQYTMARHWAVGIIDTSRY
ncbi:uncharacterized protein LOC117178713 [Belonocnema kinseyi]|uniref:uncharacterized protein LOC117178713 n=1 Tax=Belonocnema kinseyi TaxID=2817044 RepID=UPI00143D3B41|nr:uncharacterized protein LOC117178713 [Belonocnema kinseyi]